MQSLEQFQLEISWPVVLVFSKPRASGCFDIESGASKLWRSLRSLEAGCGGGQDSWKLVAESWVLGVLGILEAVI